ncbi:MAG TPA: porin [Burkholderiales bacterium]|jgi:predicted porin
MNKKVMALAVAGALAAPAAALAQVQIGGSLTVLWYQHDPDNGASSKGDILEPSEPELYFRAAEKLGGGVSVWFQCASQLDAFIGGENSENGFCNRNSGVGFRGNFGNIFWGNWDTPNKLVQNRLRGWFSGTNALAGGSMRLLANSSSSGLPNPSPGAVPTNGNAQSTSFYRRQSNLVSYHSPNWGGFSFMAAFSANNESTSIPDAAGLTPRLLGVNGQYAQGPFYVGLAYEKHDDYNPGGTTTYTGGSDNNMTVVLGFRMAGFNVRAGYLANEYETTSANTVETDGFGVFADWNISGPHTLRVAYSTVDAPTGTVGARAGSYTVLASEDNGADHMTFAYSYAVSKRTEISAAYNMIDNDTNGSFGLGKASVTVGGKQTAVGLLLKHRF